MIEGVSLPLADVIADFLTVIPDLIRDPWIAGQARNDNSVVRDDSLE